MAGEIVSTGLPQIFFHPPSGEAYRVQPEERVRIETVPSPMPVGRDGFRLANGGMVSLGPDTTTRVVNPYLSGPRAVLTHLLMRAVSTQEAPLRVPLKELADELGAGIYPSDVRHINSRLAFRPPVAMIDGASICLHAQVRPTAGRLTPTAVQLEAARRAQVAMAIIEGDIVSGRSPLAETLPSPYTTRVLAMMQEASMPPSPQPEASTDNALPEGPMIGQAAMRLLLTALEMGIRSGPIPVDGLAADLYPNAKYPGKNLVGGLPRFARQWRHWGVRIDRVGQNGWSGLTVTGPVEHLLAAHGIDPETLQPAAP